MVEPVPSEFTGWAEVWFERLTADERAALRLWQVTAWCDVIQTYLTKPALGGRWDLRSAELVEQIDAAVQKGRLPRALELYRGEPSCTSIFGLPAPRLEELLGGQFALPGFLASTISETVARRFLDPPGPGGPVLLVLRVVADTPAAPLGIVATDSVGELEVLLPARSRILIVDVLRTDGDPIPTVVVEVE